MNILIWNSWAIYELCPLVSGAVVIWEIYNSDKIMLKYRVKAQKIIIMPHFMKEENEK